MKRELDARTLRWAARRAAKYERELRGFEHAAPNERLRAMYERAALTAFVLRAGCLNEARRIERKRAAKAGK